KNYIQNYYNFVRVTFSANISNLKELKFYLSNITSHDSLIDKGLKQVSDNTKFKDDRFKIISESFSFLNKLHKNYDTSDFVMYLRSIYNEVYVDNNVNLSQQSQRLTKLVYDYYGNSKNSILNKVKSWLPQSVNPVVRNSFSDVFDQIVSVGLAGVKYNIQEVWQDQLLPSIKKLDQYYPFDSKSSQIINMKFLDQSINPVNGYFWQVFNQWLKPFLVYTPNGWINNQSVVNQALLSKSQLALINRVNMITNQFWDKSGQPQPLQLIVSPGMMMNTQLADKDFINMSFLRIGGNTIIGVNVSGVNKPINYQWWKDQSCTVGYETSMGSTVNILSRHVPLCLFSLLSVAQTTNNSYQWQDKQSQVNITYQVTGFWSSHHDDKQ
ncbi:hypothetical protein, partial [Piscirickettsia litoralis]|uniref:hypothetical protein n=1 Tax=Piscirickettsia litoralis TaxID=1891921 RepID=UPI001301994C